MSTSGLHRQCAWRRSYLPDFGHRFSTMRAFVKKNYNTLTSKGGRAALKVDLNDSWTMTPTAMGQMSRPTGPGFRLTTRNRGSRYLAFLPRSHARFLGPVRADGRGQDHNFDIVYAGAYLARNTHESERLYRLLALLRPRLSARAPISWTTRGHLINPAQHIMGRDHYTKTSNELRVSSPKEYRFRFDGGGVPARQVHEILQDYLVDNGDPLGSVPPNDFRSPVGPAHLADGRRTRGPGFKPCLARRLSILPITYLHGRDSPLHLRQYPAWFLWI